MTRRPVQREDAATVVAHEHDVTQVEPGEPRLEIPDMIMEPVSLSGLPERPIPTRSGASNGTNHHFG